VQWAAITGTGPNPAMNSRRRIRHALKLLCGQPIAVGVVWEPAEPSSPYDPRSRQFGRASASMMPQAVHTMRAPNPTKAFGRASDRREHDLLRLVRRAVSRIGSQVGERHSGGSGRRGRCHGLPAEACRALNPKCVGDRGLGAQNVKLTMNPTWLTTDPTEPTPDSSGRSERRKPPTRPQPRRRAAGPGTSGG
jgi:hypothetical protein